MSSNSKYIDEHDRTTNNLTDVVATYSTGGTSEKPLGTPEVAAEVVTCELNVT